MSSQGIPAGWLRADLGSITTEEKDRVGGGPPPVVLSSTKHDGLVPSDEFFKGRTIYSADLSNYKLVKRNWFAYATNHLAEGSIGVQARFSTSCVSPIYTVFSCRDSVDPEFLFRVLKSPSAISEYQIHEQASVDRRGAVRYRDFSKVTIDLPPLGEQRGIEAALASIDAAIHSAEDTIAKMEQLGQGLLQDLMTRGLDASGELRDLDRGSSQFHDTPLGILPNSWDVPTAMECCERISVGVVNSATYAYVEAGVPFIRSQNVRPNAIDREDMLRVTENFVRLHATSILRAGDVLIVRTGYPGTAAVVPEDLDGASCFSLVVARVRSSLDPQFLARYLNSPSGKASVGRTHFGSAQHNFNVGEMKRLRIPLPPMAEQREIVGTVEIHEASLAAERRRLAKLELLRDGYMHDLLTGRVRVTVDDGDAS